MKHNKLFTRITAILLIAIMILSGCSKKESTNTSDTAGTTTTESKSDEKGGSETPSDKDGGILSFLTDISESKSGDDVSGGMTEYYDYDTAAGVAAAESPMLAEKAGSSSGDSYDPTAPGEGGDDMIPDPGEDWKEPDYVAPAAGLLTSGEWNDNKHYDFLKNLLNNGQDEDYSSFFKGWNLTPFSRLAIHVSAGETAAVSGAAIGADNVSNALVTVYSENGNVIYKAKTDNKGMAYTFYRLNGGEAVPTLVKVESGSCSTEAEVTSEDLLDTSVKEIVLDFSETAQKKLDLMFVVDTTGSMGDEIYYLQKELEDVIKRVKEDNANIPVRLSCNFYRDLSDEYVVRSSEFSANIDSQLALLNAEHASGGGDYEEAVEKALEDAVNNHSWEKDSVKLMFMVLDAPPHNTEAIKQQLASTLSDAAEKGIRIIPVASSGVDKSTEFLLRTFAMTTGGTYTFLTDDSGIGGSHIEPTIGDYEVENLNDMLVRIISEYLQ